MDETGGKLPMNDEVKESQEVAPLMLISPAVSPSTKPKDAGHSERSPKPKDGEKLRQRLAKSKHVWRKESIEKPCRSGPMVARHSLKQPTNLKLDTTLAQSNLPKRSLVPTSPTYESAFKRQVVNRPMSPCVGVPSKRPNSFNRGKRPPSPNISVNPEEILKRRMEKAKKAKLYLLQQAGPNTFIIAGGESAEHKHKVTIGPQTCSCGKGPHCIHILFVMVRVFALPDHDHQMQSKVLKNFEVESLFRKYESRRKERLSRTHKASHSSTSADADQTAVSSSSNDSSLCSMLMGESVLPHSPTPVAIEINNKMEVTCPICLLELQPTQQLVNCDHCHNKLHHACMAIWHQLVKKQGDVLTCPLCRLVWNTTNIFSFADTTPVAPSDSPASSEVYNASPNSLGVSPVSGFTDIEPSTLLPRSQPIPEEHATTAVPWIEMFGEDLIGCLFIKNAWVMRETALRHLSREIVMLLSHPSEQDNTSVPIASSSNQSADTQKSHCQSRIEYVLEIGCQILAMMMMDPVYKVYVSSLRSLRTMLSYCTLPDVTKLRGYMKPVIQSIVLKCADGNRKTNQLSISTLSEFAKDQEGELAIGRELTNHGQSGLGGCMFVLECCISHKDTDSTQVQWLNGRLLIMNQLLEEHADKFSVSEISHNKFTELSRQVLLPMIEFAVNAISKFRNQPRTLKHSKKVIIRCAKFLSGMPGMNTKIRDLLSRVELDLRGRLEKEIIKMSITAHQTAINAANSHLREGADTSDISEDRVGSPPLATTAAATKVRVKTSLAFGSIYQASNTKEPLTKSITMDGAPVSRLPRHTALLPRRSDSYTKAVHSPNPPAQDESSSSSSENGGLSSGGSIESVEADNIVGEPDVYSSEPEMEHMLAIRPQSAEAGTANDADCTLTGPSAVLCSSDSEADEVDVHRKSPAKLSRGRFVTGTKPQISIRSENEPSDVEFDGDVVSVPTTNDQDFDVVDGDPQPIGDRREHLTVPLLQSNESMGFETPGPLSEFYDNGFDASAGNQPMEQTDSESCTDNISQSVSLSISGGSSSDDEDEDLSDDGLTNQNRRPSKKSVPFKEYRLKKHMRSKTDPFRIQRAQSSKSTRYHSDPAGGESTTASSAASTPRTPPVRSSSPTQMGDEVRVESGDVFETVKPVSRALTFSEPPSKVHLPSRPQSMRATRGAGSQFPRSKLPARSKTAAFVTPISNDQNSTKTSRNVTCADTAVPRSTSPTLTRPSKSFQQRSQTSKRPSSPGVPAVIRALTPPNSPLRSQSIKTSTPRHSPPSSPPLKQAPLSPRKYLSSRSPSPQGAPATAVVRPQAKYSSPAQTEDQEEETGLTQASPPPPQVVVPSLGLSRPIQRETSITNTVVGGLLTSTSGSSDDHKAGSDSLYVDDLSDSAVASPYEKPVSFKSEVSLFSPRDSSNEGNCHCKDEVELEEAIALAKAMDISTAQSELPLVPGLSVRREEETITIHVQPDQTDGKGDQVEYLENIHWKRGMRIGTGAFSTCYQCRDVKTGIIMAVKQISFCRNSISEQDSICEAVIEEIRMMATLNHHNIVRILGATQTGAHFNMFVEWMPGGSISHLLEQYGAFSEPVITSYTQQVLMGLAYLHDHQILHRDMKGANLLIDSTGKHLRIGDFGACAQLASSMTGAGELKGQLLGTIAFMAPEVLRGEHYGRACDVWSVGCVIIEMVTTKPPWNASNVSNHLKLIFTIASANRSPPIPENLPPGIKDLMLRCLEPESKHRPPAKELLQHPLFTRSHYRRR